MKTISKIGGALIKLKFIEKLSNTIEFETGNLIYAIDCLLVENSEYLAFDLNSLVINKKEKSLEKYKYILYGELNTYKCLRVIKAFIWPEVLDSDYTFINNNKNQFIRL